MNVDLAKELLNELGSSLEELEAQQAALLQFLKDNGIVKDDQFAPYLTQAGNTSSVRWRAARIRLDRLFSAEEQKEEQRAEDEKRQGRAAQTPIEAREKAAQPVNGEESGKRAPEREEAATNAATAGDTAKINSEADNKQA